MHSDVAVDESKKVKVCVSRCFVLGRRQRKTTGRHKPHTHTPSFKMDSISDIFLKKKSIGCFFLLSFPLIATLLSKQHYVHCNLQSIY